MQGSPELTAEARAELVQALALKPELVPARITWRSSIWTSAALERRKSH